MEQPNLQNYRYLKSKHVSKHVIAAGVAFGLMTTGIAVKESSAQTRSAEHQQYCLKLEAELAKQYYETDTTQEDRNKLKMDLRNVERTYHRLSNQAERKGCYSYFIFSKELRRTPRCIRIDKKIRSTKRALAKLNARMNRAARSRDNKSSRNEQIIRRLARNKCGAQYEREANRRSNSWFGESIFGLTPTPRDHRRGADDQFRFSTHRTLCVRLCDGYYFPVSFATTTNRFSTDEQLCQSRCAAPAKLFTHPNPGGDSKYMLSVAGVPYDNLKNAWRFRKEYIKGCSCKINEYDPQLIKAGTEEKAGKSKDQEQEKIPDAKEKKTEPPLKSVEPEEEAKLDGKTKVGALPETVLDQ